MKRIFKRNQVVVTVLALLVAVAGYLNYADKNSESAVKDAAVADAGNTDIVTSSEDESTYDEVYGDDDLLTSTDDIDSLDVDMDELVDSENANAATEKTDEEDVDESDEQSTENDLTPGETILTSGNTTNTFILEAKLSREQLRSKNKESLLEIINNTNISDSEKQSAIDQMVELTSISECELAAETLLEAKGFAESVVTIVDGSVDVVIVAEEISDSQRAQIEDVVKRKTNIGIENIVITLADTD